MRSEPPYLSRTLNLGHRGAREVAPENTLVSFHKALEHGADGVELDVMLSRDGHIVVIHDATVDRTTDGSGRVCELTLAEIKQLDAGSWFSAHFAGERIPTLEEVIESLPTSATINVELKSLSLSDGRLETAVTSLVGAEHLRKRVILSSFNPFSLCRIHRLDSGLETGLLYHNGLPLPLRQAWLARMCHAKALHPSYAQVNADYVKSVRRRGYHLNVWNANRQEELRSLIEAQVDAIITDRPDLLNELLI